MVIKKLFTQNIKRVKSVTIVPKDNVVKISGDNAQGKSSIIDSIIYGLGGKSLMPENPIRNGEKYAQTVIDLDNLIAIREFFRQEDGTFKHTLRLTSKAGHIISSPQGELDKLIGSLTFDPIEFERMKEKDQYELLSRLVGYDEAKYVMEIERLYNDRKAVGKRRDEYKALLAQSNIDESWYNLPDKEIPIGDLFEKSKRQANFVNSKVQTEMKLKQVESNIISARKRIEELLEQVENLKNTIQKEIKIETQLRTELNDCNKAISEFGNISEQLKELEATNIKISLKNKHSQIENTLSDYTVEYDSYTQSIEEVRKAQKEEVEKLQMPVQGLELKEGKVFFNGIPFSQCSGAERLQIALSISSKLNKELKIALIKDGAILDDNHLKILEDWAKEEGIQVWLEIIDKDKSEIIIEDGEISEK